MTSNIDQAAHVYNFLKQKLLEEHASLRDDEQTLHDTLDGITNFDQAVEYFVDAIADDEAMLVGLAARKQSLEARITRHKNRVIANKEILRDAIVKVGKNSVVHPEFTVSLRKIVAKVKIYDEGMLPEEFITLIQVPERIVRKDALDQAILQDNKQVPGAELVPEHKTLAIRKG